MRFFAFGAVFAISLAATASPAEAITNGVPDGDAHPSVGALIADRPYGDGTWAYCTGTLISPTVFLTAAHCGRARQKTARVSFSSHYRQGAPVHTGRYEADWRYRPGSELYDIAVIVFDTPVVGIAPARLPTAGQLDRLRADGTLLTSRFTPVGYGSLALTGRSPKPRFVYTDTRNRTAISYDGLTRIWLKLSEDHTRGDGGTCYGDSGGPNFLGATDLLVATTISGDDDDCAATNYDYRLDTSRARGFLGRFVRLP